MFKFWKEGVDGSFPYAAPMMFEKGGSAPMPPPPNPMEEARAQILVDEAKRKAAQEEAARKEREDAAKRSRDLGVFNTKLAGIYNDAKGYASKQLNKLGVTDRYGIISDYRNALLGARNKVPELSSDIGAYLDPDKIFSDVYDTARGAQRSKLNSIVNRYFGSGFENNLIQDTADDPYIEEYLSPQLEEARAVVDRAKARGQLNDFGYQSATKALDRQLSSARSKAQGMGNSVLSQYRRTLTNDVEDLRDRIQNYDLTDRLDLNSERQRITDRASTSLARLREDVANALGGTEFFDINNLLGRALVAGGIGNNGNGLPDTNVGTLATAMASALTPEELRRQLGNTGAF